MTFTWLFGTFKPGVTGTATVTQRGGGHPVAARAGSSPTTMIAVATARTRFTPLGSVPAGLTPARRFGLVRFQLDVPIALALQDLQRAIAVDLHVQLGL